MDIETLDAVQALLEKMDRIIELLEQPPLVIVPVKGELGPEGMARLAEQLRIAVDKRKVLVAQA